MIPPDRSTISAVCTVVFLYVFGTVPRSAVLLVVSMQLGIPSLRPLSRSLFSLIVWGYQPAFNPSVFAVPDR